jgi:tetratricopeptide (TPR) repeat protein
MTAGLRTCDEEFDQALDFMIEGNYEDALVLLGRVTAFEQDNTEAYLLWVDCHIELERYYRAIELADIAIGKGFAPAELGAKKSLALRRLSRLDEAAEAARTAIDSKGDPSEAIRALAKVELARGQPEEAIRIYREAQALAPDDEETHFDLLEVMSALDDRHETVVDVAKEYLQKFGKDPDVLATLGHAYVALNKYAKADRAFRDAAEIDPEDIDHHVNVVMLARLRGDDRAFDDYVTRIANRNEDLADRIVDEAHLLLARIAGDDVDQ